MKKILFGVVLVIALGFGVLFYLGQTSQNGTAPGLAEGRLTPCPSDPNCVSSEPGTPVEKYIEPLPTDVWVRLPSVIADMGGVVIIQDDHYLAAEFTSSMFKFVDDMEFRLAEDGVHVRSGSRVGYSDQSANNARVAALRERLGG